MAAPRTPTKWNWTPAEINTAKQMRAQRASHAEIACVLDRSISAVQRYLSKHHILLSEKAEPAGATDISQFRRKFLEETQPDDGRPAISSSLYHEMNDEFLARMYEAIAEGKENPYLSARPAREETMVPKRLRGVSYMHTQSSLVSDR